MKSSLLCLIFLLDLNFAFGAPINKALIHKILDSHNINTLKTREVQNDMFTPLKDGTIAYTEFGKVVKLSSKNIYGSTSVIDIVSKGKVSTWLALNSNPSLYVPLEEMKDIEESAVAEDNARQKQLVSNNDTDMTVKDFLEFSWKFCAACILIYMFFKGLFSKRSRLSSTHTDGSSSLPDIETTNNKDDYFYANGSIRVGSKNIMGNYEEKYSGNEYKSDGIGWNPKK